MGVWRVRGGVDSPWGVWRPLGHGGSLEGVGGSLVWRAPCMHRGPPRSHPPQQAHLHSTCGLMRGAPALHCTILGPSIPALPCLPWGHCFSYSEGPVFSHSSRWLLCG